MTPHRSSMEMETQRRASPAAKRCIRSPNPQSLIPYLHGWPKLALDQPRSRRGRMTVRGAEQCARTDAHLRNLVSVPPRPSFPGDIRHVYVSRRSCAPMVSLAGKLRSTNAVPPLPARSAFPVPLPPSLPRGLRHRLDVPSRLPQAGVPKWKSCSPATQSRFAFSPLSRLSRLASVRLLTPNF